MKRTTLIVIFLIGLGFAALGLLSFLNKQSVASISNFEECAAAGYPIMESYPEQCATPDGRSFTRELSEDEQLNTVPPVSCGDGICQDITCDAIGCPEPESPATCPQDCPYDR